MILKTLCVPTSLDGGIARALCSEGGESPLELLPNLLELQYSDVRRTGNAFSSFMIEREAAGKPLSLTSSSSVITSSSGDSYIDLNNFLQYHPRGNLTVHCSWVMTREGPSNAVIHTATAMYRGAQVGQGMGVSSSAAKRVAAERVLAAFMAYGVPEP
ncbi:hypothetical protein BGW80DRAFT_1289277 [Lactifluus volemus]|nr:hypothetical protein BGW80DRAFT_1289277 [Lactifluus volemus]